MWREEVGCLEMLLSYYNEKMANDASLSHRDFLYDLIECYEERNVNTKDSSSSPSRKRRRVSTEEDEQLLNLHVDEEEEEEKKRKEEEADKKRMEKRKEKEKEKEILEAPSNLISSAGPSGKKPRPSTEVLDLSSDVDEGFTIIDCEMPPSKPQAVSVTAERRKEMALQLRNQMAYLKMSQAQKHRQMLPKQAGVRPGASQPPQPQPLPCISSALPRSRMKVTPKPSIAVSIRPPGNSNPARSSSLLRSSLNSVGGLMPQNPSSSDKLASVLGSLPKIGGVDLFSGGFPCILCSRSFSSQESYQQHACFTK